MDTVIVDSPKEWMEACKLRRSGKIGTIYVRESVAREFNNWACNKATFFGFMMGMTFSVAIALICKLVG